MNSSFVRAGEIRFNDNTSIIEIYKFGDLLIDSTGQKYCSEDIVAGKFDALFKPTTGKSKYRIVNANYWLKFKVIDASKHNFYLEAYSGSIDSLELFIVDGSGVKQRILNGARLPFSKKLVGHKNIVFPLPKLKDGYQIYIRANSDQRNGLKMVIKSDNYFIQYALTEYWVLGLFYGILLLVILQNVFLYLKNRTIVNLYYIGYVIGFVCYSLSINGLGFQFIWPSLPNLNPVVREFAMPFAEVFLLLYLRDVLNLETRHEKVSKWLSYLIAMRLIAAVALWLTDSNWMSVDFILFTLAFLIVGREYKYQKGYVKYVLLGFFALFLGIAIQFLWVSGILAVSGVVKSIVLVYVLNIASIIEVVLFSLAITERIKEMDLRIQESQKEIIRHLEEKDEISQKVNKELEDKVSQRTEELQQANQKLEGLMTQINAMNISLDEDNRSLKKEQKEIVYQNLFFRETSEEQFMLAFPQEVDCLIFLHDVKWGDISYRCRKCNHTKYNKGIAFRSRRCSSCNYEESCTNGTIFERLRIDLRKAFYMAYLIFKSNGKITIDELMIKTGLNKNTVWRFKKRIVDHIEALKKNNQFDNDGWDKFVLLNEK